MRCKRCNGELADNAKFCSHCGAVVEQRCPNAECGRTGLPAAVLFCPDCGTRLEAEQENTAWRSPNVAAVPSVLQEQYGQSRRAEGKPSLKQSVYLRYVAVVVALVAFGVAGWLLFPHAQKALMPLLKPAPENYVLIRGGEFIMGSPMYESEIDEKPQHPVKLSDYYISKYEGIGFLIRKLSSVNPRNKFLHLTSILNILRMTLYQPALFTRGLVREKKKGNNCYKQV